MHQRTATSTACLAIAAILLSGCTSGASTTSASAHRASGVSVSTRPTTATATTPTGSSTRATCVHPTRLTYRRQVVALNGYEYDLPPDGATTTAARLPVVGTVRATTTPAGTGPAVMSAVGRHWRTHVQAVGQSTTMQPDARTFRLRDPSHHLNMAYAVVRYTQVYSGTFTATCAGLPTTGDYRTFGALTTALINCADPLTSEVERVGHRQCS